LICQKIIYCTLKEFNPFKCDGLVKEVGIYQTKNLKILMCLLHLTSTLKKVQAGGKRILSKCCKKIFQKITSIAGAALKKILEKDVKNLMNYVIE